MFDEIFFYLCLMIFSCLLFWALAMFCFFWALASFIFVWHWPLFLWALAIFFTPWISDLGLWLGVLACWSCRLWWLEEEGRGDPLPGAEGVLHPPLGRQLPGDLSHERHGQALPDLQEGFCLRPPSQVGRCPLADLKQDRLC